MKTVTLNPICWKASMARVMGQTIRLFSKRQHGTAGAGGEVLRKF